MEIINNVADITYMPAPLSIGWQSAGLLPELTQH